MILLATDLDGTFLAGEQERKNELYQLLRTDPNFVLVFVTGRGVGTVKPLIDSGTVPAPRYIISDVGATIVHGATYTPIDNIVQEVEEIWPGEAHIDVHLRGLKGLKKQTVPMQRRSSYFYDASVDLNEIYSIANSLGVDALVSAGKYIDFLPRNVNKGSTLKKLVSYLSLDTHQVIVAGDTLNDLSLFETGYRGIVVGGAEPKLVTAVERFSNVYIANEIGTGGILEGLFFYRIL